jgi:hypothetical protein
MTPILATVLKVDKRGNEYLVTVQLGNDDFSGPLEKLSFENKPDQGWCHYGWLNLIYHRDPNLRNRAVLKVALKLRLVAIGSHFPVLDGNRDI